MAELTAEGLRLNVTALLTLDQVRRIAASLENGPGAIVSLFAGRIADTGRDAVAMAAEAVEILAADPGLELLWASPREIVNVIQAASVGCHIITLTDDLLPKLAGLGRDLEDVSLETVQMFHRDASASSYLL